MNEIFIKKVTLASIIIVILMSFAILVVKVQRLATLNNLLSSEQLEDFANHYNPMEAIQECYTDLKTDCKDFIPYKEEDGWMSLFTCEDDIESEYGGTIDVRTCVYLELEEEDMIVVDALLNFPIGHTPIKSAYGLPAVFNNK